MAVIMAVLAVLLRRARRAADLKVTRPARVRGLIAQIIDDYSRQTGQKIHFTIGTTGNCQIIASGQPADLIIVSAPLMGSREDRQAHARQPRRSRPVGIASPSATARRCRTSRRPTPQEGADRAKSIGLHQPAEGGTSRYPFRGSGRPLRIADAVSRRRC